jgi:hypothetical protein
MTYMSAQDRESRIKELEVFRDDWQKTITSNSDNLRRLTNLKIAGIDEYDQAIIRATEAGKQLAAAKSNIEAAIERVRAGSQ